MRVVRDAHEPKSIVQGLHLLKDFLNAVGPRTTKTEWKAFLKRIEANRGGSLFFVFVTNTKTGHTKRVPDITLEEAKEIRWWINNDLRFLRTDKELEMPFDPLIFRLSELKLETGWQCFPFTGSSKPRPGQAILTNRWRNGSKGRWTAQSWPVTRTVRDSLYAILGGALVSGTLTRLKVCRECGKYLVVAHGKRDFCPNTKCKDTFYNREKSQKAYFKKYLHQRRKAKDRELKAYALKFLDKLSRGALSMPSEKLLGGFHWDALDTMLENVADGILKEKVWARASSRKRALFRKLQLAGIN